MSLLDPTGMQVNSTGNISASTTAFMDAFKLNTGWSVAVRLAVGAGQSHIFNRRLHRFSKSVQSRYRPSKSIAVQHTVRCGHFQALWWLSIRILQRG
jgi:hypothetical protein